MVEEQLVKALGGERIRRGAKGEEKRKDGSAGKRRKVRKVAGVATEGDTEWVAPQTPPGQKANGKGRIPICRSASRRPSLPRGLMPLPAGHREREAPTAASQTARGTQHSQATRRKRWKSCHRHRKCRCPSTCVTEGGGSWAREAASSRRRC